MRSVAAALLATSFVMTALAAGGCSSSSNRSGFDGDTLDAGPADAAPPKQADPQLSGDLGNPSPPPPTDETKLPAEVFGHSANTLYKLDPDTNGVTVVGKFNGCDQVIDLAIDEKGNIIADTFIGLYHVDKKTAQCTQFAGGSFPNSLSFVPKGTLDPAEEALVGYNGSDYVRIDTKSGISGKIGSLGDTYTSSGDIVSVKGGHTYLTVKGGECLATDCLVEVDPKTGGIVKNWGLIGHQNVFGLAFWGGAVYGFDDAGEIFEVTFNNNVLATKGIPIPQKPDGLSFWGAGSTTSAPLLPEPK